MVDAVLAEFGKIDILVNNAGNVVSTPAEQAPGAAAAGGLAITLDVNLTGSSSAPSTSLPRR